MSSADASAGARREHPADSVALEPRGDARWRVGLSCEVAHPRAQPPTPSAVAAAVGAFVADVALALTLAVWASRWTVALAVTVAAVTVLVMLLLPRLQAPHPRPSTPTPAATTLCLSCDHHCCQRFRGR